MISAGDADWKRDPVALEFAWLACPDHFDGQRLISYGDPPSRRRYLWNPGRDFTRYHQPFTVSPVRCPSPVDLRPLQPMLSFFFF